MCEALAPDVFRLDEDGFAVVLHDPIPAELADDASSGVRACPVSALEFLDT